MKKIVFSDIDRTLAIKEFGPFKGFYLGVKRILKCRPKGKCGFNPIPLNIKGELKWLI